MQREHPFPAAGLLDVRHEFGGPRFEAELHDVPADDFLGRPSGEALGAAAPVTDDPLHVERHDAGVDGVQQPRAQAELLDHPDALGDVPADHRAARDLAATSEDRGVTDGDVDDRPVLAPPPRLEAHWL
jgi:hypothetical protein